MGQQEELANLISKALAEVVGICDTSRSDDLLLAAAVLAAGYRKVDV